MARSSQIAGKEARGQHQMNAISPMIHGAVLAALILLVFAIGLAIERIAPVQAAPAEAIKLNLFYRIFHELVRSAASTMPAGVSLFSIGVVGGGLIKLPNDGWKIIFSSIVHLLVLDFAEYLFHRAQHAAASALRLFPEDFLLLAFS